jgi:transcriptional regulator with XRE-family HTH domain
VALNKALKIAIIERGTQREVAALTKIEYTRLSQIVRSRVSPNESEKLRLSGVLQKPVEELFPEVTA